MAVTNDEELEAWLEGQSQETCTAIAHRAAMRVLPFALDLDGFDEAEDVALMTVRCSLTSGVAAVWPTPDVKDEVQKVAYSASASAYSAADSATYADSAYSASAALSASASAARSASASASAARSASARSVRSASASAALSASAARSATYADTEIEVDRLMRVAISVPDLIKDLHAEVASNGRSALEAGGPWAFWAEWYAGAMKGEPLDWALQEKIALIPDDVWERGPQAVADEIEKLRFQNATSIAPRLVRDEDADVFRIEHDPDVPRDVAEFATHRARQALAATLASVSDNVFNAGSYEAHVITETLAGPKTLSLLALGLYDACLGLNANIGDRYPKEVALINLQNTLACIVDELCELDSDVQKRCAKRAGYVVPDVGETLTEEELRSIPEITQSEVDDPAREVIESDVERILSDEAAMPRWRRIRLANWMTTISIYWDRTKKSFKEAETLAKMVSKLRAAWRNLDGGGE